MTQLEQLVPHSLLVPIKAQEEEEEFEEEEMDLEEGDLDLGEEEEDEF